MPMVAERPDETSLKILHVMRAPLGGLFRHVLDLTHEQIARGHRVGLIADSTTGGTRADEVLAELAPALALGLTRVPMTRLPGPSDISALAHVIARCRATQPDIVHGHGSKGGLYARLSGILPGGRACVRCYTPHGGSFNYKPGTAIAALYMGVEKLLARNTDIFLFESAYIGRRFDAQVGATRALRRIVPNGIGPAETLPVQPAADAVDFLYVGELRAAKGIDTLIDALAEVGRRRGRNPRALLVGTGPERAGTRRTSCRTRPRRARRLSRCHAGARGFHPRAHPRRSLARRIAALYRDRGRRRPDSDDRHRCRRDSGDFRPLSRSAHSLRRCRAARRCNAVRTRP